jgi:uncharacterized protein
MANPHGHFVWYELMTTDVEAAKAFYTNVMGWTTRDASTPGMPYTLFAVGEASVGGLMRLPPVKEKIGAQPRWVGYVAVDDVDASAARTTALGGAVHVPPTDIPDISRFSVIADPQLATLTLIKLANPDQERPQLDQLGHVGWHELLADDWEKAFAFYGEVFDWQKANTDTGPMGTYQLFSVGGKPIGGMSTKPQAAPAAFWLYYFNVGEIDAAAERVKAGGGKILEGPTEVPPTGWLARCVDPQGAMFALIGKRNNKAVGYFERVESRDPSGPRGRWSW